MGSAPSTPQRNGSDDPWWPIENQNLTLNPDDSASNMAEQNSEIESDGNQADFRDENKITASDDDREENIVKSDEVTTANEMCEGVSIDVTRPDKENQSLEEFKEELRVKREKRQNAIAELRNEITSLRSQLAAEKALNQQLIDEKNCIRHNDNDAIDASHSINADQSNMLRIELADVQLALQTANSEILRLTSELAGTRRQVNALKDVIAASKEMVEIREAQLHQVSVHTHKNTPSEQQSIADQK